VIRVYDSAAHRKKHFVDYRNLAVGFGLLAGLLTTTQTTTLLATPRSVSREGRTLPSNNQTFPASTFARQFFEVRAFIIAVQQNFRDATNIRRSDVRNPPLQN
jgi:hypothetical protein